MIRSLPLFLFLASLMLPITVEAADCNQILYVPENLRQNVAFWERIYQQVPSDRGLMHDQDSLRVVYDTLFVGNLQGRARSRACGKKEKEITAILSAMAVTDKGQWDSTMQFYGRLWGRELSPEEWRAAAERVRFQLGQKSHFILGIQRSGRYLDKIKQVFRENGLPEELAYLPHVESSFNYKAYSKVGAAGIWQFMRGTGRVYLKIGYVVDERLEPMKSTQAAMKLLRSNYARLKSWPLALTAYNHGVNSMERAVTQTGSTDIGEIVDRYKTRSFQFASKNFYASYVAAYRTASNYRDHFGEIRLEPPFEYMEFELKKNCRPSTVAKSFGVPLKTLQEFNLDVRPPVFKSDQFLPKGHTLKLPLQFAGANVDSIFDHIPAKATPEKPLLAAYHKVRAGENLSTIAAHYGLPLSSLLRLNNLRPDGCVYPGLMLQLPGGPLPDTAPVAVAAALPSRPVTALEALAALPVPMAPTAPVLDARLASVPVVAAAKPPKVSVPATDTSAALFTPAYLLALPAPVARESDDSLSTLWTFLYPALLKLATVSERPCGFNEFSADFYKLDFTSQDKRHVTFRVQIDETIGHYAEWAGIPSARIKALNNISNNVRLGQTISLPLGEEQAEEFLNRRIEQHMSIEEDFFSNFTVTGMDTVAVKKGANVWTLCQENDIPLWLFMKANRLKPDLRITDRDRVLVPQAEEKKKEGGI
ncbi:MAG: transglycosylase SLT domain-containing protein [Fibrobacterota bacterium]